MRFNNFIIRVFAIALCALSHSLSAQPLPNNTIETSTFEKALDLYNKGQYGVAQKYFDDVAKNTFDQEREQRATASYYATLCALYLYNRDAGHRLDKFAKEHALSPLVNQLYLTYANNKFSLRRYHEATEYYEEVNTYRLSKEDLNEMQFKWGYALLENKEPEPAKKLFFKLKDNGSLYSTSAKYYYAHLLYTDSNYTEALTNFLPLQEDESFGPLVPYYLAHIYYRLGEFDKLLEVGEELVENATPTRAPEIAKLMADAFYNKQDYKSAIKYLELFQEKGGRMRTLDNFEMGYSYYQEKRNAAAIEYFNKITRGDKALQQSAYYHLADCYLKTDNKNQALTAFKAASEINASATIREDAYFNYAKLSYELSNPYEDAITTLNDFIAKFPESSRVDEINQYLANLYITTKDYDKALLAIKRTGLERIEMREVYQKVAFYRATELFNSLQYGNAIIKYNEALNYPINVTVSALCMYWKAEAYYRLKEYQKSIDGFEAFRTANGAYGLSEFNLSFYQSGYGYYQLKDYQKAATQLRTFTTEAKKKDKRVADAYLRIADAYLLTGGYLEGGKFYQKALDAKVEDQDYAYYQRAICLGLAQKPNDKIAALKKLIEKFPNSSFAEDAAFEIGNTHLQQENYEQAIASFQKFKINYASSTKIPEASLAIGLAYRNTNRTNNAINVYRSVVAEYPGTEASKEAVGLARLAYEQNNDIDTYLDWVQDLDFVSFEESTLDSTAYNAAFDQYANSNCAAAITGFQNYLSRYEKGIFGLDATYYLATCAQKEEQEQVYINAFQRILNFPKNKYTAEALQALAYHNYQNSAYGEARKYYRQLANIASAKAIKNAANLGIMRTAYKLTDYTEAAVYGDLVSAGETNDADVALEARRIAALSKFKLEQYTEASEDFTFLRNTAEGEIKAEAMYHLAKIQHEQQEYELAKNTINTLVKELPAFKEYKIKALLLLAKNYWKQDDIFQANYIIEFIVKTNHSPESVQEAKALKQQIEDAEAAAMAKKQQQLKALNNPIKLGGEGGITIIDAPEEEPEAFEPADSTEIK